MAEWVLMPVVVRQVMRSENMRLNHEKSKMLESIKDNKDKIRNNKQLPYLVANVVEVSCPCPCRFAPCLRSSSLLTTPLPDSQNRSRSRRGRNRRISSRFRFPSVRDLRRHQDLHPADHLPPPYRPRPLRVAQTVRPDRRQQGFVPHSRHPSC